MCLNQDEGRRCRRAFDPVLIRTSSSPRRTRSSRHSTRTLPRPHSSSRVQPIWECRQQTSRLPPEDSPGRDRGGNLHPSEAALAGHASTLLLHLLRRSLLVLHLCGADGSPSRSAIWFPFHSAEERRNPSSIRSRGGRRRDIPVLHNRPEAGNLPVEEGSLAEGTLHHRRKPAAGTEDCCCSSLGMPSSPRAFWIDVCSRRDGSGREVCRDGDSILRLWRGRGFLGQSSVRLLPLAILCSPGY